MEGTSRIAPDDDEKERRDALLRTELVVLTDDEIYRSGLSRVLVSRWHNRLLALANLHVGKLRQGLAGFAAVRTCQTG